MQKPNRTLLINIALIDVWSGIDTNATLSEALVQDNGGYDIYGQWYAIANSVTFTPDTPLGEGMYTVTLYPTDTLGNSRTSSITFSVDLTAPQPVTLNPVTSPTNTTPQTISGTKEANTSVWLDNNRVVPFDGSTEWSYDLNLSEGENSNGLFAKDRAGNLSETMNFTIILDRAPPVLVTSVPVNGAYINIVPAQISLLFNDAATSLDEATTLATASIQNSHGQSISGTWTLQEANTVVFTPTEALPEEAYTVSVQARDVIGNAALSSISFTCDYTPPIPPTLNPVTNPTNFSIQTISGIKEPNSSVWLNGSEVIGVNPATSWSYQVTLTEGENQLEIYAKDVADNQSDSVFASIDYDNTPPLPVSNLTANGEGIGTTVTLDWTGYDEFTQGDIDYYRVYMSEQTFTSVIEMNPIVTFHAGTYNHTVDNLTKGISYYFAAVAVDTKGNALASVTPISAISTDIVAPENITNLQVQSLETSLIYSWGHSANLLGDLAGYKVYFNNDSEGVQLDPSRNTYEATSLNSSSVYPCKIIALDTDGNESSGVSITGYTLLHNPLNLSVTPHSGLVDLTWDAVVPPQNVKHYLIYVSETDFSSVDGMTAKVTTKGTSASVAGLTNNVIYYFAITAVNYSDGERKEVATISSTPITDMQGPVISNIKFDGVALISGSTVEKPGIITLYTTDPVGIGRVEFHIDGSLYFTDSNGSSSYSCFWNIVPYDDGNHTLSITAFDTLGNSTTVEYTIQVVLDVPSVPTIIQPISGITTNNTTIEVSGTAEKFTEIVFYNNNVDTGSRIDVDNNGSFNVTLQLAEEENRIQASARNRAGNSPLSSEVFVTLDTSIPASSPALSAQPKAAGVIRLTWQTPINVSVKGYDLYRADTPFISKDEATKVNSSLISGTSYSDIPPSDGTYYYRVTTISTAENESELSDVVSAESDNTMPRAVSIHYTPSGQYDSATGRMAPGIVGVLLTVSEPLQTFPFLSISPEGGFPISIELTKASDLTYSGQFEISDTTPTGTAYAVFSARDKVGNRGTEIDSGGSLEIDTDGPVIIHITVAPEQPIQNDENNPVSVTVTIGLNEVMQNGEVPALSYLLSGSGRIEIPVENLTEISMEPNHAQTWQGSFTLSSDAALAEVV